MSIQIYNTLSGKKESFVSIEPGHVSFYACGVTVYDRCHIGHARAYTVFDMVRRYLTHRGYTVKYVQNFTDIDDKIIQRSVESDKQWQDLVAENIDRYFEDMDRLGIQRAEAYPRATETIGDAIRMIRELIDKGAAYESEGDVLFSVGTFDGYGKLSKKVLDELEAGSRVDVDSKKRNPLDFVLWKAAKAGEPSWGSPWGEGRPGWHIECSAMVRRLLGETIDIHAGGEDLVFPHHENEIAQSESCTGCQLANFWIHNGFVNIKDEKMSKSLKNIISIHEILEKYDPEAVRFFLLRCHYRTGLSFSYSGLDESCASFDRLKNAIQNAPTLPNESVQSEFDSLKIRFFGAMDDDFNSAEAIGVLFEMAKLANKSESGGQVIRELGQVLGFFVHLELDTIEILPEVQALLDRRAKARSDRDFAASDQIRDQLAAMGYQVEDTSEGQRLITI